MHLFSPVQVMMYGWPTTGVANTVNTTKRQIPKTQNSGISIKRTWARKIYRLLQTLFSTKLALSQSHTLVTQKVRHSFSLVPHLCQSTLVRKSTCLYSQHQQPKQLIYHINLYMMQHHMYMRSKRLLWLSTNTIWFHHSHQLLTHTTSYAVFLLLRQFAKILKA